MNKSLVFVRLPSSEDRRIKIIYRTNKGKQEQKDALNCFQETNAELPMDVTSAWG